MASIVQAMNDLAEFIKELVLEGMLLLIDMFSKKTRIERIMYQSSSPRSCKNARLEVELRKFKSEKLREFTWDSDEESEIAETLLPNIDDEDEKSDFAKALALSLRQIKGYGKLCQEIEARRVIAYDPESEKHEKLLLKLWKLLKEDEELESRRTNQWQDIGFQGDDPATDFRGMGILGLEQLVFFAQYDASNAQRCLSISLHPKIGFPFAICGITITKIAKDFLYREDLKNHFYNSSPKPPTLDDFHRVYCRIFSLYCDFWVQENPESVMQFNLVKEKFVVNLTEYLLRDNANLVAARLEDIA